jgi:hypothetical protein
MNLSEIKVGDRIRLKDDDNCIIYTVEEMNLRSNSGSSIWLFDENKPNNGGIIVYEYNFSLFINLTQLERNKMHIWKQMK